MKRTSLLAQSTLAFTVGALSVPAMAQLEEIVVTAQKREQSLQDVPLSVDVLSDEFLARAQINSAIDLAQATPSLNFQQAFAPFGSSFGMRGLNTFALEGGIQPSVSFVVDGVPLARVGEFQAELGDVERIEVLHGPQGTLFGRNATAGAINVVRKKPTHEFEGYVEGSATNDGEYITRFAVSGPITDAVRGRLAGYGKRLDDYIDNHYPGGDDMGGEDSWGLLGKLEIDLSDRADLLLTAEYRKQDTNLSPSVVTRVEDGPLGQARLAAMGNGSIAAGRAVVDDFHEVNINAESVSDTENWGLSGELTWDLGSDVTLKSITAYRVWDLYSDIDVDGGPANINNPVLPVFGFQRSNYNPNPGETPIVFKTDYFTQELRFEGYTGDFEWIAGGFYQLYTDDSRNEVPIVFSEDIFLGPDPSPLKGIAPFWLDANPLSTEAQWENWSAFGDLTWHLTDSLRIFGGLRWTREDVELEYFRRNIRGPATQPYFNALNSDDVNLDLAALQRDFPFFQQVTDFERDDRSEDWSGRLGVSWDVAQDVNLYASASRGFIGSGVNFGRNANFGNSIVYPSVSEAYEVGMKSSWMDNSLRANLAVFWQEVDDLQTSRLVPGTVNTETFNAGTLESRGMEANLSWQATDQLTLDLMATLLDTEMKDLVQPCYPGQSAAQGCNIDNTGDGAGDAQDVSGKNAISAPDLSYRVSARYDLWLDDMPFDAYVQASYTWQDDIQFKLTYDPLTEQDAYGITDLVVGIQDKAGRYELSLFGRNLGDEEFLNNRDAAVGVIGRQYGRAARQAQSFYGIKAKYNF